MIDNLNRNGYYTTFSIEGKLYKFRTFHLKEDMLNSEVPGLITYEELKLFNNGDYPDYLQDFAIKKIQLYDKSSAINSFIYKGNSYWLNKELRASISNLLNAESVILEDNLNIDIELVFDDTTVLIPKLQVLELISKLEIYAHKCLVVTNKHIAHVKNLESPLAISLYDFTVGYPDKIIVS